jgi:hypothetical protein
MEMHRMKDANGDGYYYNEDTNAWVWYQDANGNGYHYNEDTSVWTWGGDWKPVRTSAYKRRRRATKAGENTHSKARRQTRRHPTPAPSSALSAATATTAHDSDGETPNGGKFDDDSEGGMPSGDGFDDDSWDVMGAGPGLAVGDSEGTSVGLSLDTGDGLSLDAGAGDFVGDSEGTGVGLSVGDSEGTGVGLCVGDSAGIGAGDSAGIGVGLSAGDSASTGVGDDGTCVVAAVQPVVVAAVRPVVEVGATKKKRQRVTFRAWSFTASKYTQDHLRFMKDPTLDVTYIRFETNPVRRLRGWVRFKEGVSARVCRKRLGFCILHLHVEVGTESDLRYQRENETPGAVVYSRGSVPQSHASLLTDPKELEQKRARGLLENWGGSLADLRRMYEMHATEAYKAPNESHPIRVVVHVVGTFPAFGSREDDFSSDSMRLAASYFCLSPRQINMIDFFDFFPTPKMNSVLGMTKNNFTTLCPKHLYQLPWVLDHAFKRIKSEVEDGDGPPLVAIWSQDVAVALCGDAGLVAWDRCVRGLPSLAVKVTGSPVHAFITRHGHVDRSLQRMKDKGLANLNRRSHLVANVSLTLLHATWGKDDKCHKPLGKQLLAMHLNPYDFTLLDFEVAQDHLILACGLEPTVFPQKLVHLHGRHDAME